MSDTPKTDAAVYLTIGPNFKAVCPNFARQLERENAALREALRDQIDLWECVPSGVDYDADENDPSPKDTVAHLAGLGIMRAKSALDAAKKEAQS